MVYVAQLGSELPVLGGMQAEVPLAESLQKESAWEAGWVGPGQG